MLCRGFVRVPRGPADVGRLATVVVGAGPAGLLFAALARLLAEQRGIGVDAWPVWVVDKRATYVRTHRLRMDPGPYRDIAASVADPRFDAVIAWLAEERFRPAINDLEDRLSALVAELGVQRAQLEFGGSVIPDFSALKDWFRDAADLADGTQITIVGADSVHSDVRRQLLGGAGSPQTQTHAEVARLKIEGADLPKVLGWLDQYRLSKLLGSVLDYRLNQNGHAEVDLFLEPSEHRAVAALGARPAAPVVLDAARLKRVSAPLFRKVVRQFSTGLAPQRAQVSLTSTFRLDVQHSPRVARLDPASGAWVFLVGDAAVSLPFFRGMACLGACAMRLASLHVYMGVGSPVDPGARYTEEVDHIRAREDRVVASRSWLIRFARDFARISALLPFPIQSWFLRVEDSDPKRSRWSGGLAVNLATAALAATIALTAPWLDAHVWEPLGWLWLLALPLQFGGGALYDAARIFEPPNRALVWTWRLQVLGLMVLGPVVTVWNSMALGRPAQLHSLGSWFVLGLAFAAGVVVFEAVHNRLLSRAAPGEDGQSVRTPTDTARSPTPGRRRP